MSDLRPILRNRATDAERRLLRSARLDVPPASAKGRVLASLGLAAAATTTIGTSGVAAAATASAGWVLKCIAVGTVGGVMVASAVEGVTAIVTMAPHAPSPVVAAGTRSAPRPSAPTVIAVRPSPPPESASTEGVVAAESVAPGEEQADPASAAQATQGSRHSPPGVNAEPPQVPLERLHEPVLHSAGATLAEEVDALDEARRALSSGDARGALVTLDSYEHRVTSPRLGPEATVLRIEALLAERDFGRARELGDELLAKDPDGAYAQHVRTLLAGASQ